jgi:3-isopropylmalate dehydrogenase
MIVSAGMMLEWLAERKNIESCRLAYLTIEKALAKVYGEGRIKPFEFGGSDGTKAIAQEVSRTIREVAPS